MPSASTRAAGQLNRQRHPVEARDQPGNRRAGLTVHGEMRVRLAGPGANKATAADPSAPPPCPGSGRPSGGSRYRASPPTLAGSRTWSPISAHHRRWAAASRATIPPPRRSDAHSYRAPAAPAGPPALRPGPPAPGRGRCAPISSATATAAGTRPGSPTPASSASHTPSANRSATRWATSPASRVFPIPPGPVTVTIRYRARSSATSFSSTDRPTKLVSTPGKPCTPGVTPTAGAGGPRLFKRREMLLKAGGDQLVDTFRRLNVLQPVPAQVTERHARRAAAISTSCRVAAESTTWPPWAVAAIRAAR